MGCSVNSPADGKPSALDWDSAAETKGADATNTPGVPRLSRSLMSCTLHVVQLPQSANASITASHVVEISCRRSTGAGLVKVGVM